MTTFTRGRSKAQVIVPTPPIDRLVSINLTLPLSEWENVVADINEPNTYSGQETWELLDEAITAVGGNWRKGVR